MASHAVGESPLSAKDEASYHDTPDLVKVEGDCLGNPESNCRDIGPLSAILGFCRPMIISTETTNTLLVFLENISGILYLHRY